MSNMPSPSYTKPENSAALAAVQTYFQLPKADPSQWSREVVIYFLNLVASRSDKQDSDGKKDGTSPFLILTEEVGLPKEMAGVLHSLNTKVTIRKMKLGIKDSELGPKYQNRVDEYIIERKRSLESRV